MSIALNGAECMCRCQMVKILQQCYVPRPDVETLNEIADWKSAINPSGTRTSPPTEGVRFEFALVSRAALVQSGMAWPPGIPLA